MLPYWDMVPKSILLGEAVMEDFAGETFTAIAAGDYHVVGLREDGTVAVAGPYDGHDYGQGNVSSWSGVVFVAAGSIHTVAILEDGTAVAAGSDRYGQCGVSGWSGLVSVAAGESFTVGLLEDGSVVAVGENDCGQLTAGEWTDVIAISARYDHAAALKEDGTLEDTWGAYARETAAWTDVDIPEQALEEAPSPG